MNISFPSLIEFIAWDDIPDRERNFSFVQENFSVPIFHLEQIRRVAPKSAHQLGKWFRWYSEDLRFPYESIFQLKDEHWNTDVGIQAVRKWLHECNVPYAQQVFLFYDNDRVFSLPWKLLIRYWDVFAWRVGYAMIVADHTTQWVCCFHHENVIIFGSYTESHQSNSENA